MISQYLIPWSYRWILIDLASHNYYISNYRDVEKIVIINCKYANSKVGSKSERELHE